MGEIKDITLMIVKELRDKAIIKNVSYEGPALALYTPEPEKFYENPKLISDLASKHKKRLVLRSDPTVRQKQSEAKDRIIEILSDFSIDPSKIKIYFDSLRGEIHIYVPRALTKLETKELELKIVKATKWIPRFRPYYVDVPDIFRDVYSAYLIDDKPLRARRILNYIGERIFREYVRPSKDISLIGLGGVGEVGRSSILLKTSESKVLIDFGAKVNAYTQEDYIPRIDAVDILLNDLDAIILTHAHIDHSGLIPFLYKYGYDGPVYMTEPTLPLTTLLLKDFIEISRKNGFEIMYNIHDIKELIRHAIVLKYNQVTDVSPDIKLTFFNAGHILGSAMPHIHIREGVYNILFTGDFKFGHTKLLDPAQSEFSRIETLVIESTYGAKSDILPPRKTVEAEFAACIRNVYNRGGKLLIPTPGVGRAQEILAVINFLLQSKKDQYKIPEIPVYIDGMIDEANKIHFIYSEYLNQRIRRELKEGENPFSADNIIPIRNSSTREEAIDSKGPAVIISTSGMMQGGPIIEYFINLADSEKNTLAFVSYQAPNTLGRKLADGNKRIDIVYDGKMKTIDVKMEIKKFNGFTGHSDRRQLMGFVGKLKHLLRNVYVVHGEFSKILSLSQGIGDLIGIEAYPLEMLSTAYLKE